MKKIGILTNIDANHGSCIFNTSLNKLIADLAPEDEVKFLDFLNPPYRMKETLRAFKTNRKIPFYNFQRYLTLKQVTRDALRIDPVLNFHGFSGLAQDIDARNYDTLITGKVMWDISPDALAPFPNVYWLSPQIGAKKIAYAISGHRTDLEKFTEKKKEVYSLLRDYCLIGVRDDMTQVMMDEAGITKSVPVYRITDPAFFYEQKLVDSAQLFAKYGIAADQPILGLLYYGKPQLSEKICRHYHQKGYQVINFNMFNPYADLNIGHLVSIDEWVALIQHLDFCITDRFHVSIFCLRESTPFVAFEPYRPKTPLNSKIISLLDSFHVKEMLYHDTYQDGFDVDQFLSACDEVKANWGTNIAPEIRRYLALNNQAQRRFLQLVKNCIAE